MNLTAKLTNFYFIPPGMSLGVPMHVFGTETHMTAIVGMALGRTKIPDQEPFDSNDAATMFFQAAEVFMQNPYLRHVYIPLIYIV